MLLLYDHSCLLSLVFNVQEYSQMIIILLSYLLLLSHLKVHFDGFPEANLTYRN